MRRVRPKRMSALVSALAATCLVGCFDPEIPACLACRTGECPRGQKCVDGYCSAKGLTCAQAGPDTCQNGRCCFGERCFAVEGPAELALWLDWTSIRPREPGRDLQVWLDRSGLGHDARSFGDHKLVVERSPLGGGPVARSLFRDAALMVDEGQDDALGRLGGSDFFVLAAMALPCDFSPRDNCLFQKLEVGPVGFWLATYGTEELIGFISGRGLPPGEGSFVVRGYTSGLRCDRFYLFGLRRVSSEPAPRLEVRVNGVAVHTGTPPANLDADGNGPLQIGSGTACGSLSGATALTIGVDGPMSDGAACRLEQFALDELARGSLMDRPKSIACGN